MSRVELPVLELPDASDVDPVELAVKYSVGLDRAVPSVSPIVAVPQRRPDKSRRRGEPDYGTDSPPTRIPIKRCICRRPITNTVDGHGIIDRDINVIRLDRLDDDVFGRPHIARAWRRRDSPDLLLLARFEIAGFVCLGTQCLNCVLDVVRLSQKGLTELLGPVELFVHHREDLRDRRQSLDARIPPLVLHCPFESRPFEVRILFSPTRR